MEALFQAIYSGILYGSVYGLMALGLTLIWGSLRMLNLAHGSLYLVGGYLAWTIIDQLQLPLVLAFLLAVAGTALVKISTVLISNQALVVIATAVLFLVLMSVFLRTSRHGLAIRAISQDMDAARLAGVPARRAFLIVMCISAGLAGLAGVLLSSIFYLAPTSGFVPMVKALVVTIFGGLGSVKGTIWAAYTIGLLEAMLQVYLGAGWALPGLFLFMIVMLVVRPNGLFGLGEVRRL